MLKALVQGIKLLPHFESGKRFLLGQRIIGLRKIGRIHRLELKRHHGE